MPDNLHPTPRSAAWVILGGLLLAAAYLPTLTAPFDFTDDGNLVYPTPGLSLSGHVELWWQRVVANVEHLGPFRPVVWAHWHLEANLFGNHAVVWRAARLAWCAVAAGLLLALMRELRIHPVAALIVGAAAMWNPYRNEIWTSLTLAEGVAMPYALLALVAARKAGISPRSWRWDAVALVGLLMALGCKNTFVALLPPMLFLRMGGSGWRVHGWRAAIYLTPMLMPAIHFVYFKMHPGPCHYETPGPSWEQAKQFALWLKGTAGVDFLAVGVMLVLIVMGWQKWMTFSPPAALPQRGEGKKGTSVCCHVSGSSVAISPIGVGLLLLISGFVVYLPVNIMCGRYTIPAVWGVDLLLAALLSRFVILRQSWPKWVGWAGVAGGLVAMVVAGVNRQEKVAARSKMLWELLTHVERTAPTGSTIEWVSGPTEAGELNAEEGIHFAWHLLHRGRIDVRVGTVDRNGTPISRVELASLDRPARYRISATPSADPLTWQLDREVSVRYRLGSRVYSCVLERRREPETVLPLDPLTERLLREGLGGFDPVKTLLNKHTGDPSTAARPR